MSKPIELMHVYFGENKNTCGTCCNLVEVIRGKKKLRKCKAYGGFHSSKADWAKKWVACGLYGEHVPQPMVSDTAKQIFYRVGITQEVIGCDGQMEMAAERDRYKAERDAAERESPQPSTNADRIRGMSDDELAKFLATKLNDDFYGCPDLILQWLQQPAEEE